MTIAITLKELQMFVTENGYLIAIYCKGQDGNWHYDKMIEEESIDPDTVLMANYVKGNNHVGGHTNMNETVSKDKQHLFKLHNNYNIPKIIRIS